MLTAAAKGLAPMRVLGQHGLRVAAPTLVTVAGLDLGTLLGGVVIIESLFSFPGLGRMAYDAISSKDLPVIMGVTLFSAVLIVAMNVVVDLAYAALDPRVLIADEPTTALDVTVQAQILDLLLDLRDDFGSAVVLVTHDLGVVAQVCDRVLVMYAGRVVEEATVDDLFHAPAMPYTWGLLGSVPRLDRTGGDLVSIPGSPPSSLAGLGPGCAFAPRCGHRGDVADDRCATEQPELIQIGPGHAARCHLGDPS